MSATLPVARSTPMETPQTCHQLAGKAAAFYEPGALAAIYVQQLG